MKTGSVLFQCSTHYLVIKVENAVMFNNNNNFKNHFSSPVHKLIMEDNAAAEREKGKGGVQKAHIG